jgi:hypothetical protein
MDRKYPMAKRYQVKELAGEQILFAVVNDLSDEYLVLHLQKAIEDEDYDYCAELAAEANLRGLIISNYDLQNFNND